MTASNDRPASEVYELVIEDAPARKRWLKGLWTLVLNLPSEVGLGTGESNPGARIFFVRERATGDEFMRHIEEIGDEGHLLEVLEEELATKTAAEFAAAWRS